MREAIRKQLMATLPDIQDRVYEPHAPNHKTAKPFLVLQLGTENKDVPWVNFQREIEIWPCVARTTFGNLDKLSKNIIKVLDKERLTSKDGKAFSLLYRGIISDDTVIEDWDVLTRCLRFSIVALQQVDETIPDDPWLIALKNWTTKELGKDWTIYLGSWPLDYVRPSILWRVSGYDTENMGRAIYKINRQISGHILGRTPNEEAEATLYLLRRLEECIKIPLNEQRRTYMTLKRPECDLRADPIQKGQLIFNLYRYTGRPKDEAPIMMHIYGRKN